MTKCIEIVSARAGGALVETYVDGRRTAMSEWLPVVAARIRADTLAAGDAVVDHTLNLPQQSGNRAELARGASLRFRPAG